MESRTQGSRPRTQKNFEAKDRPSRGQGHRSKCSPNKQGFQKIFPSNLKKKVFKKFFSGDFHLRKTKKDLCKFSARFLALSNKISTVQKIVLSSSRGQGNFRGLEASRPRTSKSVLGAKDVLEDSTSGSVLSMMTMEVENDETSFCIKECSKRSRPKKLICYQKN